MSLDANKRPSRRNPNPDLWPKWMWIAVPVLVVVVVAALWWAIFSEPETATPTPTPTPTPRVIPTQPAEKPTPLQSPVSSSEEPTATRAILPPAPTFTPTPIIVATPATPVAEAESSELEIGTKLRVSGTGGAGLNLRAGPGTEHPRIKTLPEGSVVELVGGPTENGGFVWRQVRDDTGTVGWGASRYLTVAK